MDIKSADLSEEEFKILREMAEMDLTTSRGILRRKRKRLR